MAKHSTWNSAKAKALAKKVGMQALHEGAESILAEAQDNVPIDTGTLRRSATVTDAPSENAVYISYNTPYAVRVHEGFGPHVIMADEKRVLAVPARKWQGGPVNPYTSDRLPKYSKDGKYVILGAKVNHPGFPGVKYLERPFNAMKDTVMRMVQLRVRKALEDAE